MNKKEAYTQELQTQLDEFSAEIERLKARADKAEEPWHRQQVDMLQAHKIQSRSSLNYPRY
jgi:chromosome segregation ATPase